MTEKERIDALGKLATAAWDSFNRRAGYEWKVTFGLWTGLGLVAGFLLKENIAYSHPTLTKTVVLCTCALLFAVYVFVWTRGVYARNTHDKQLADFFWRQMEHTIGILDAPRRFNPPEMQNAKQRRWKPEWFNWSHGSQIIITLCLLLLVAVIFCFRL